MADAQLVPKCSLIGRNFATTCASNRSILFRVQFLLWGTALNKDLVAPPSVRVTLPDFCAKPAAARTQHFSAVGYYEMAIRLR